METEADDDEGLSRWMLTTLGLSVGLTVLLLGLACYIISLPQFDFITITNAIISLSPNNNHSQSDVYLQRR